jgi:hypothetical protein
MSFQAHYLINSGLCWLIVLMALAGYFLTVKRTGQKWPFWLTLGVGWSLMAISNSLTVLGIAQETSYLLGIWLSSYVLVVASMLLLFVKLIQLVQVKQ